MSCCSIAALGHTKNFFKRIFYTYFLRDFNIATLQLLAGLTLGLFGITFGLSAWSESIDSGIAASAGTVMLAGLTIMIGIQMLLGFLQHDISNQPTVALQRKIKPRALDRQLSSHNRSPR